jgi:hypothetical protein
MWDNWPLDLAIYVFRERKYCMYIGYLHFKILEFHILGVLSCLLFYCCCAGWGYIVAFTKVLTMYQIYHT